MEKNAYERPLKVNKLLMYMDNVAVLECPSGLPPGSRVCFNITNIEFRGKVIGLKKTPDNHFGVSVRLHLLSKENREMLEQILNNS